MAPARAAIRVIGAARATNAGSNPLSPIAAPKLESTLPPMAAVARPAAAMIQKGGSRSAWTAVMPPAGEGAVQRGGQGGLRRLVRPR